MRVPVLFSVPHGGLWVPPEVQASFLLSQEQIIEDGDKDASEIYDVEDLCSGFVRSDVARAVLDLNREEADFSPDGVVKTHSIFGEAIYNEPLTPEQVEVLLDRYYRPYHRGLSDEASGARLGIDGHTMLAESPPTSPTPGVRRPRICLSNAEGATCPAGLFEILSEVLARSFSVPVAHNDPFKGGHIIRAHAKQLPWVQLEISRETFMTVAEKRSCLRQALEEFAAILR